MSLFSGKTFRAVACSILARYFYDKYGRATQAARTIDGNLYNTQFFYDPLGDLTSVVYPDSDVVNCAYDNALNMSIVSNGALVH